MVSIKVAICIAVVAYGLFRAVQMPDIETGITTVENGLGGESHFDMTKVLVAAPRSLMRTDGSYIWGRFRAPVPFPEMHTNTPLQRIMQKKQWTFMSVTIAEWMVGFAVADMGYVRSGLAYVYNSKTQGYDRTSSLLPMGMGATSPPSSISGCAEWSVPLSSKLYIQICRAQGEWNVTVEAHLDNGTHLSLSGTISGSGDQFAMNFPIGPRRPAYTHKCAGMQMSGLMRVTAGRESGLTSANLQLKSALGLLDFTKAMHRRLTKWWWVALSHTCPKTNRRVGLQLSTGVYMDKNGIDLENAVWVDGVMHVINEKFEYDGQPGKGDLTADKDFKIRSASGGIDLVFRGRAAMDSEIRSYPIADGNLRHWFGVYSGSISAGGETFVIEANPGILEDHYAIW